MLHQALCIIPNSSVNSTGVTVHKRSIRVTIGNFLSRVTLKFDGWPWQTMGHLFYATSSFVLHFKAISELKLDLQSGNAEFRSQKAIFVPCVLEIWWMTLINKNGHLFYAASNCARHFIDISVFKLELQSWNSIFVSQSMIFWSRVTLKFDQWTWKTIGDLS